MDQLDRSERQVVSLSRRLAEAAAVELARLHLVYSEKFVREELLYPLMAIAPSAQRWQPSTEAPFEERKVRRAPRGDIRRADLKFWRLDSRVPTPLEVIVEVKLLRSALPKRTKQKGSATWLPS